MKKFKLQKKCIADLFACYDRCFLLHGNSNPPAAYGYADPTSYERCVCIITSSDAECRNGI